MPRNVRPNFGTHWNHEEWSEWTNEVSEMNVIMSDFRWVPKSGSSVAWLRNLPITDTATRFFNCEQLMNTLRCPVIIGLISNASTIPRSLDGHMARHQLSTYLLMYSQWQVRPNCCVGISSIKIECSTNTNYY